MDAIRKIVNSDELISVVSIPKSLQNKQVELIILPVDEQPRKRARQTSAYGILKKYSNPDLIASEEGAWESAVQEKYALR
jgi:hypothetical protein